MARYLNKDLKNDIQANIKIAIQEKLDESELGKELVKAKNRLEKRLRFIANATCTEADLVVLEKFNRVKERGSFDYFITKTGNIKSPYWNANNNKTTITFEPAIRTNDNYNNNDHFINLMDSKTLEQAKEVYKIDDSLQCELQKTLTAYMARVHSYHTVKALLKAHPKMKIFIPEKLVEVPKSEKLIDLFEKSTKENK